MHLLLSTKTNPDKYRTDKPVFLRDTKLKGFAIKVNPSGKDTYIVEYHSQGRTIRSTLSLLHQMSLSDAKKEAMKILGDRPNVLASQNKMSLSSLLNEYLSAKTLKERTIRDYKETLDHFPNVLVHSVSRDNVLVWYKNGRDKPTTTDRVFRQLNAMFNYAIQMGYLQDNPFSVIRPIRYRIKPREGYLEPTEQLPMFWKELNRMEQRPTVMMVKMYLLTGMRSGEMYKVSVDSGSLIIPNTKNGRDHIIPIIPSMPIELFSHPLPATVKHTLANVCNRINVPVVSTHDLRRTVGSLCAYLGVSLTDIKKLLNHSSGGDITLHHYIRHQPDYLLPVMNTIEKYYLGIE